MENEMNYLPDLPRHKALIEKCLFEFLNAIAVRRYVVRDILFSPVHKFWIWLTRITTKIGKFQIDEETKMQTHIREYLLSNASTNTCAELQALFQDVAEYPYVLSKSAFDEIWDFLRDRSISKSFKLLINKQLAVSDIIWDVRRAQGDHLPHVKECVEIIWRHFALNIPFDNNDLHRELFTQSLVDRLRPNELWEKYYNVTKIGDSL